MKPDWREDQMCDIAFDMFLEDSKYDETENAIFTLMHKAFLEGFKTWIKAEKYNKNKKQDDPSCFFMRKNETLFGL